jgi:hypothetical protein
MRPQKPLPEGARESLEKLLKEAKSKLEYQRVLCVATRSVFLVCTTSSPGDRLACALGPQASGGVFARGRISP